jgi:hypothetical protein
MLEVPRQGEVVWSFVTPTRNRDGGQRMPIIADAVRYRKEALPFLENADQPDSN